MPGTPPLFSVITPSAGKRPRALAQAIASVEASALRAGILARVEMLVGFDGVRGERPVEAPWLRYVDFPPSGDYGNRIRDGLLRAARGGRVLFVDDDNAVTPEAFSAWLAHMETDMLVARVDTSRAFDVPFLPVLGPGEDPSRAIRQCNVDPLCLCLSRRLVELCWGWRSEGRYESDFLNIRRFHRRAASFTVLEDVVGVYDAGRGLDPEGGNPRQRGELGAAVLRGRGTGAA
jgi:hypothetical protein